MKNVTIYLFETNNTVQSDWNYLEQKQNMFCNNKFTLKQIDMLRCVNVTLIQIDISIWYKVPLFTVYYKIIKFREHLILMRRRGPSFCEVLCPQPLGNFFSACKTLLNGCSPNISWEGGNINHFDFFT